MTGAYRWFYDENDFIDCIWIDDIEPECDSCEDYGEVLYEDREMACPICGGEPVMLDPDEGIYER